MSSCAHPCVTWRPPVWQIQSNAGLSSSACSFVSYSSVEDLSHGCRIHRTSSFSHGIPAKEISNSGSSFLGVKSSRWCISNVSSRSDFSMPQYHQNRRIELQRFRVVVQNGELRFRRAIQSGDSRVDSDTTEAQLDASVTRRDVLIKSGSAILATTTFLGSKEFADAAVSRRVRLKDVEDQKLQDALRAAVAGDLENAEILFTQLIKEEPSSASVWSNRGSVRISLGKFELATKDFTKAIELAPEAPVPYLNRAISYEATGHYDEAIADCKTAIENDPEEPAAWFNLGNVEARVKDYDSSLSAYQRASILAPGIAGYRLRQALVLFQVGRLEEAKKLMQGLVRKYPNYTEAHAALAAELWAEGQRSSAEDQFSEATIREPLYSKISWVETELQWPPGVLQAYAKFLSIDFSKS